MKKIVFLLILITVASLNITGTSAIPPVVAGPPVPTVANGGLKPVLLEELPGLTNEDILREFEKTGQAGFTYYLQWIIRIAIALGSIIAVSTLIFGGFLYITTDNFLSKGKGRMMIINALWGFVLLLMSYVLLGQINSNLLQIKFAPKVVQAQVTNEPKLVYGISLQEYNRKYRDSAAYKQDDFISHYIGNKSKKMADCFLRMSQKTYTYESGPRKGQVIPLSERQCISVDGGLAASFIGMVIPKQ